MFEEERFRQATETIEWIFSEATEENSRSDQRNTRRNETKQRRELLVRLRVCLFLSWRINRRSASVIDSFLRWGERSTSTKTFVLIIGDTLNELTASSQRSLFLSPLIDHCSSRVRPRNPQPPTARAPGQVRAPRPRAPRPRQPVNIARARKCVLPLDFAVTNVCR